MENENKNENKFVTVFNFECKDCHTKIGQLVSDSINIENIECPNCKSKNTIHGTVVQ